MKIGISIKLDVTKIDKNRLFKGAKGTYLDLTTFIDTDNPDQYQNHGFIAQSVSKEEKAQRVQTPILGNCKVFWGPQESQQGGYNPQGQGGYQPPQQPQYNQPGQPGHNPQDQQQAPQGNDEDIPF